MKRLLLTLTMVVGITAGMTQTALAAPTFNGDNGFGGHPQ
jgi:hypothetical protein